MTQQRHESVFSYIKPLISQQASNFSPDQTQKQLLHSKRRESHSYQIISVRKKKDANEATKTKFPAISNKEDAVSYNHQELNFPIHLIDHPGITPTFLKKLIPKNLNRHENPKRSSLCPPILNP